MKSRRAIAPVALDEIVRRIVEVAQPEPIIVFGSAARGETGPNGGVELPVIVRGPVHRGRLTEQTCRGLRGVGEPVDVVVVTSEDGERDRDSIGLTIRPTLREGRVISAA